MPVHLLFNHFAAKGSKLHSLIKENHIPFFIDRIAGGTTYFRYNFNKELIAEYRNLLGDDFLGFQLHESGSTRRLSEWVNVRQAMGSDGPYDAEELKQKFRHPFLPTAADGTPLYRLGLESPEYFATMKYAHTIPEFLDEMRDLYRRRLEDSANNILTSDSYYLLTRMQDQLGVHSFMPEVGAQICLMRQAVALARGMARAAGKMWGTYYECWRADLDEAGNILCSMPCYNLDPINERYMSQEVHPDDFTSHGKNGGSSRLLQERIYYHTLMSGADYLAEEWGLNCSYTDMQTFDLSEYGLLKKDFIDRALDLQNVQPVVPFAIVLPKEYECVFVPNPFEVHEFGVHNDKYMDVALTPEEKDFFGHIEDVLKLFFARNGKTYGNESHVLTNSRFGDVADIIYEDAAPETFARYKYLIDASPDGRFAKANPSYKVVETGDFDKLTRDVDTLIAQTMPIYADGLHWLVSTDDKGRRFLTVFNNEGNQRTTADGDVVNHNFDQNVTITLNVPGQLQIFKDAREDIHLEKTGENTYCATVSAADFVIFEF